jgi:hypothetical protein
MIAHDSVIIAGALRPWHILSQCKMYTSQVTGKALPGPANALVAHCNGPQPKGA